MGTQFAGPKVNGSVDNVQHHRVGVEVVGTDDKFGLIRREVNHRIEPELRFASDGVLGYGLAPVVVVRVRTPS